MKKMNGKVLALAVAEPGSAYVNVRSLNEAMLAFAEKRGLNWNRPLRNDDLFSKRKRRKS